MATTIGWPDHYRPETLEEMALAPELRQRFEQYLAGDVLPRHLILHGPPGFGKTTLAEIIARNLYNKYVGGLGPRVRWVKATETGSVEDIRNNVLNSMRILPGPRLLIFEEATGLSPQAQEALRVPLENWAEHCRVIFITNSLDKLDPAIKSRCEVILVGKPPAEECSRVLNSILVREGHDIEPATVLAFTRAHFEADSDDDRRDLRTLLAAAQHAITTEGVLPLPPEPERESQTLLEEWHTWSADGGAADGAKLLNDLATVFSTYVSLPRGGAEVFALWTVFAWAHEAFSVSPILALVSPTMRAGKTTVLDILEQVLIPEATYHPSNLTPAVAFRLKGLAEQDQAHPPSEPTLPSLCLLLDEADTWLRLRTEIISILNSGHT